MKILIMILSLFEIVYADAFQEGHALGAGQMNVNSMESLGFDVNENPSATNYTDHAKISAALEQAKQTDEAFQQIKKANAERERYEFSLTVPLHQNIEDNVNETLGGNHIETAMHEKSVLRTCLKRGESYSRTCKRQRIVEIKVTPEVRANHPRFCLGHWNRWGTSKSYCNGCKGGESYISQEKKVETTRDEWVGCEDLETLHDAGKAEVISETLGSLNEARVIEGETITKDYWETTRTYALNTDNYNECDALQAIGCQYQDGICEVYGHGMAGERICLRFKMTYRCPLVSHTQVLKKPTLGMTLPPVQTSIANQNMVKALSQMEAMRQISKHMEGQTEADLRIFRGEAMRCTTNFGGSFKDCCKRDGGTGTRMHLATQCSTEEKNLALARAQKRCVFVGARQKNQTLGMNVSKEYVYCCFSNKLGLAIQQGARAQLGQTFGEAISPRCDGLTPDELARVNFDQLDLTETFADIAASAQKAVHDIKRDLTLKQKQFERPQERETLQMNQHKHKRIYTDPSDGENNDITY